MKLFNMAMSSLILVLFTATSVQAEVLFENNLTSVTRDPATQEVTARFNLHYGVYDSDFWKMLKDMGVEIDERGHFTDIALTYDDCKGNASPLIMICSDSSKRMTLTDTNGKHFEMSVDGKAFSHLVIDQISTLCESGVMTGPVFNPDYQGSVVIVNGISSRQPTEDYTKRGQIIKKFLLALTNHVKWLSRGRVCNP